ncbi:MAG TPA: hypothetical protein VGP41_15740 [Candidatus Lustribacter sp.]|jgi:hypothetical protein|nr:hypothetical protein [Candidatus Lustribacter sp.]
MHVPFVRQITRRAALMLGLAVAGLPFVAVAAGAPRLTLKSGSPQTARAWVAARANRYETHFDAALVVNVAPAKLKVRFRCVTHGCEFPAMDQPDSVSRVDPSAMDVVASKGEAAIKLIVWTDTPEDVVVVAQPADATRPQVRFLLNER